MTLFAVGYLAFLLGLWCGVKVQVYASRHRAFLEGWGTCTKQFLATHEALKAAKPDGDVHWIEAGWYRFDLEAPAFRTLDALAIDDYLAQDLREAVPGEPRETPPRQDILGDPEE